MQARRDHPSIPAWSQDQLASPTPPQLEDPYFDNILGAWVLSRHADILEALRASSLFPASPKSDKLPEPRDLSSRSQMDRSAIGRLKMRQEAMEALSPAQLRIWRKQLDLEVHAQVELLPVEEPLDLMEGYAKPICLSLAALVTGISRENAEALFQKAERVSAAAAEPYDRALDAEARCATAQLRPWFHSGPETLRDSGFVALSQTLPCILGNAWFALIDHPQQWRLLHRHPELMEQAIEELLRYAGLARTLSRIATADTDLNGSHIRKGERIILRIFAAARDPERFPQPNRLDVRRRGGGHLALGAGPHSCVAANLIRMAAVAISEPLVQRFASASPVRPVDWKGGSGFRSPSSLWVRLTKGQLMS